MDVGFDCDVVRYSAIIVLEIDQHRVLTLAIEALCYHNHGCQTYLQIVLGIIEHERQRALGRNQHNLLQPHDIGMVELAQQQYLATRRDRNAIALLGVGVGLELLDRKVLALLAMEALEHDAVHAATGLAFDRVGLVEALGDAATTAHTFSWKHGC